MRSGTFKDGDSFPLMNCILENCSRFKRAEMVKGRKDGAKPVQIVWNVACINRSGDEFDG